MGRRKPTKPHDPWADIPEKGRPTPEQRAKHGYRVIDGNRPGQKRVFRDNASPLDDCHLRRNISTGKRDAGRRFEQLANANGVSTGPRSCLDWMPRGASEEPTEYQIRVSQAWKDVCAALGMETVFIAMDVCCFHNATGPRQPDRRRWVKFHDGLRTLCLMWGMEDDEGEEKN